MNRLRDIRATNQNHKKCIVPEMSNIYTQSVVKTRAYWILYEMSILKVQLPIMATVPSKSTFQRQL